MYTNYTSKDGLRFWDKVDKSPHSNGCWIWTAATAKGKRLPYGMIGWGNGSRKMEYAHRVSYLIAYGAFDELLMVLHKCDNPPCVNPEHLFLGTHQDNMDDKSKKRRCPRGEDNAAAKLTMAKVAEIRREHQRYKRGGVTQLALAKKHGVTQGLIGMIVRGEIWK